MIKNIINTFPHSIFKVLQETEFDFYLSGSHYWSRNFLDPSEWVFFVKEHPRVETYLKSFGFIESQEKHYYLQDVDTAKMLTFSFEEKGITQSIHVQLSNNPNLKNEILVFLKEQFPIQLPGDKDYQQNLWNRMFSFCYNSSNFSQSARVT